MLSCELSSCCPETCICNLQPFPRVRDWRGAQQPRAGPRPEAEAGAPQSPARRGAGALRETPKELNVSGTSKCLC